MNRSRMIRHGKYLVLVLLCYWPLPSNGSALPTPQSDASKSASTDSSEQAGTDTKASSLADSYRGSMRRAPSGSNLAYILALATILNPKPSIAQKAPPAPSINSRQADSPTERFVLKSVHDGIEADLTKTKDRRLKAEFLDTLLFRTAASAVPSGLVSIKGAVVEGIVAVPNGSSPVPNNIVFTDCEFKDPVLLSTGRFEQSLIFINPTFHRGLSLDLVQIKGDVFLVGGSVDDDGRSQINLNRAQVEGQLQLMALHAQEIVGEGIKAKNVLISLDNDGVRTLFIPQVDADSVFLGNLGRGGQARIGTLNVEQGTIERDLYLQGLTIHAVRAKGLRVSGTTTFLPDVTVEDSLDLGITHHGLLSWKVPSSHWPREILASGLTFDDLDIYSGNSGASDLNVELLTRARSSESAFTAYEQILRSRGQLDDADAVYAGMHEKRRTESWLSSEGSYRKRLGSIVFRVLDKGQAIFLGYGRFPLPPVLWSIGFVLLGGLLFSNKDRMDPAKKDDAVGVEYTRFWYSLELFLPVVDLGVAKSWKPKESHRRLRTYARVHQLAGWVLIPVTLAALTGVIK